MVLAIDAAPKINVFRKMPNDQMVSFPRRAIASLRDCTKKLRAAVKLNTAISGNRRMARSAGRRRFLITPPKIQTGHRAGWKGPQVGTRQQQQAHRRRTMWERASTLLNQRRLLFRDRQTVPRHWVQAGPQSEPAALVPPVEGSGTGPHQLARRTRGLCRTDLRKPDCRARNRSDATQKDRESRSIGCAAKPAHTSRRTAGHRKAVGPRRESAAW